MIKYALLVYILNAQDSTITIQYVNNIEYSSKVECIADMAKYKPLKGFIEYACEDSSKYFNKEQRLY